MSANDRLAIAAGLSEAAAEAATGPVFPIGFAPGAGIPTHAEIDDMVGRWNAKVIRAGILWDSLSTLVDGTFDKTNAADDLVAYCCTKQIGLIFQVGSGPTNNGKMYVPATIVKFAQLCRAVLARYNGTTFASGKFVLSVSMGNEPNHAKWDDGVTSGVNPSTGKGAAYAEIMIRITDPAFNDARAIVNCPPIQIAGLGGESFRNGIPSYDFTVQAYQPLTIAGRSFPNGWKGTFDIFDQHPYSYPILPSQDTTDGWFQMLKIRDYMLTQGDDKPIAITEIGDPTVPETPANYDAAKALLVDAVTESQKYPWVWAFCWFSYMNNNKTGLPAGANDNDFGIVLNNPVPANAVPKTGTTTPGYAQTFANLAAGSGQPPPPTVKQLPVLLGLCASGSTQRAGNIGARPAGVKLKRIDVNWWTAQPTNPTSAAQGLNDTYTWANLDAILTAAAANGYQVIGMCAYTPPWAGGNGTDGHNYPRGPAQNYPDYANFCRAVAERAEATHPGVLVALEWWNEPNQNFLAPVSVANYVKLAQGAQAAVKQGIVVGRANRASFPQIVTITGGTGAAPPVGSPNRHLNWTRTIVQTAPACADHFGIHAYSGGCPLGTANGYDPAANDIPGIRTALNANGRADAQIVNTESGFFTRLDSTPTNTTDAANCGHYGTNPGDQSQQVTITVAAQLLTASTNWWFANKGTYKLGPFLYYEQDDSQAADLFNSGGLYTNPTGNFIGAAKTDGAAVPVLLNAFLAALGGTVDTTGPAVTIPTPTEAQSVTGDFVVLALANDETSPSPTLTVKLYRDDGATLVATMFYTPGEASGFNFQYDGHPAGWADGTYQLRVKATDQAGNTTTSARRTITIANGSNLPRVDDVTPTHGPTAGGTRITLTGLNFTGTTGVTIGGNACTAIAVGAPILFFPLPPVHLKSTVQIPGETITCTTPAGTAGTKNVRVTTPTGMSPVSPMATYTYDSAPPPPGAPTVTLLEPAETPLAGGDTITATGTDLDTVTGVTVGGIAATGVLPLSATQCQFVTPASSTPGPVGVLLTNPAGTSAPGSTALLTYRSAAPVMTATGVRLADGTLITDLTKPIDVSGTIRVYMTGVDDVDSVIAAWVTLVQTGTKLADGQPAPGNVYYVDLDTHLIADGAATLAVEGRDSEGNVGVG